MQQSQQRDAPSSHPLGQLGTHVHLLANQTESRVFYGNSNPPQSKNQDRFRMPQGVHILETYRGPSCPALGQEGMATESKHTNKGFQQ